MRLRFSVVPKDLGQSEVGDLGAESGRRRAECRIGGVLALSSLLSALNLFQQDVRRFEIAVDDSSLVCNLNGDRQAGDERSRMAIRPWLGIEPGTLRLRAFRIRAGLATCIEACRKGAP